MRGSEGGARGQEACAWPREQGDARASCRQRTGLVGNVDVPFIPCKTGRVPLAAKLMKFHLNTGDARSHQGDESTRVFQSHADFPDVSKLKALQVNVLLYM